MRLQSSNTSKPTRKLSTLIDRVEKDAKGSLTAILILGIIRMEKKIWGYQIKKLLREITAENFQIKDSSLYTILNNLQEKYQLIQSTKEGKLRYYSLTERGFKEIKRVYSYWQELVKLGNVAFEKMGFTQSLEILEVQ